MTVCRRCGLDPEAPRHDPTVYYLSPGPPQGVTSGGFRNLYDHVAVLNANGIRAAVTYNDELPTLDFDATQDLIVVPEVYRGYLRELFPPTWRRVAFVQNSYYAFQPEEEGVHEFWDSPNLVAILTDSDHSTERLRSRFPGLPVPIIRTHSSANGRDGGSAGWSYGPWPRERVVAFFSYKHEPQNQAVFQNLTLPDGWQIELLTGTDVQVRERMRRASVFVAANQHEGMCAPTCEAMIAGTPIVCWTGGGPDEYLLGRAVVARQDDVADLRIKIVDTCNAIDAAPDAWAAQTRAWSDWFQATYSRQEQVDEICRIMKELL